MVTERRLVVDKLEKPGRYWWHYSEEMTWEVVCVEEIADELQFFTNNKWYDINFGIFGEAIPPNGTRETSTPRSG